MIDDDFSPDFAQIKALGHLLERAQLYPLLPAIREWDLYRFVYQRRIVDSRQSWLDELKQHGLVKIVQTNFRVGDRVGEPSIDVCLTVAGVYYIISHTALIAENAYGLTEDLPSKFVDGPASILDYYSPSLEIGAPAADTVVRFDHNSQPYIKAVRAIDLVASELSSDNSIGSEDPAARDRGLEELKAIRQLLEQQFSQRAKLLALGWSALGFIMAQFAQRPVAELANHAWEALKQLMH